MQARIQRVPQPVTHEVRGEHHEHDCRARKRAYPPGQSQEVAAEFRRRGVLLLALAWSAILAVVISGMSMMAHTGGGLDRLVPSILPGNLRS